MKWYNIELELPFFGKDFELIDAESEDQAILVAKKKVVKKYFCKEEEIIILSCKEIKD